MKKIILTILIGIVTLVTSKAQNVYSTNLAAGTNIIITTPIIVSSLTILSSLATTVKFYDADVASLNYSSTNQSITRGTSNYTASVIFTNSMGIVNTNTYSGQRTYFITNSVAGGFTNKYPVVASISVSAAVPVTIPVNLLLVNGFSAETTNAAAVAFIYSPFTP